MDVKSTSGRQGHHLILFFPHFLARKFLLHLIRSSDSTSVPCIKGSLESYSYHYQLGHLLTHGIRYHTPHTHTHVLHSYLTSVLVEDKERRKMLLYAAFWILNSCIFLFIHYVPYIMRLYGEAKYIITSKAWVCS